MAYISAVAELLPLAAWQLLRAAASHGASGGSGARETGGAAAAPSPARASALLIAATGEVQDAAAAAAQLWPLGQRLFLMGLWDGVEGIQGGVEAFASMCDAAMGRLPEMAKALSTMGFKSPGR